MNYIFGKTFEACFVTAWQRSVAEPQANPTEFLPFGLRTAVSAGEWITRRLAVVLRWVKVLWRHNLALSASFHLASTYAINSSLDLHCA